MTKPNKNFISKNIASIFLGIYIFSFVCLIFIYNHILFYIPETVCEESIISLKSVYKGIILVYSMLLPIMAVVPVIMKNKHIKNEALWISILMIAVCVLMYDTRDISRGTETAHNILIFVAVLNAIGLYLVGKYDTIGKRKGIPNEPT